MAKISFGSLLKNPLVLGVLATQMTGNLARSYTEAENQQRAEEAQQTEQAKALSVAGGTPITEMPRTGLFGKIGSKLGLVSPNVPLKPYQVAEESQAILGQQAQIEGAVKDAISMRKELGPQGWQNYLDKLAEGNQFEQLLRSKLIDIPQTPYEKRLQDLSANQGKATVIDYGAGPGGTDLLVRKAPGESGHFHAPYKPDKTPEQIERESAARTRGVKRGDLESDIASSPNPFYDPVTMYPITKPMSKLDAKRAGYIPLNANGQLAAAGLHAGDKEIDRLEGLARQYLLPTLSNLSTDQKLRALGSQWLKVQSAAKFGNADAISLINASTLEGIKVIHDVQKRYPSQIELKTIQPMLPNGSHMAADDFINNLENLRNYLHAGVGMGVREDAGKMEATDAEAEYNAIIGGGGD